MSRTSSTIVCAMFVVALLVLVSSGLTSCRVPAAATASGQATANTGQPSAGGGIPSGRERTSPPETAEACRSCNGIWAIHGIGTVESCNCRTRDGGRRCRDGGDCEGACVVAQEPELEVVQAGPPARGFFVGRCSDVMTVFGCHRFIDRGATQAGPILLTELPAMMCVD